MTKGTEVLFVVALVIGIVAAGTYVGTHVSAGCYDFYLFKTCGVVTK